ncbi:MAG: hypothetical protein J6D30_03315 [Clostridia bacterium]|nr:hypothetical protein [Clostridia bacterium]
MKKSDEAKKEKLLLHLALSSDEQKTEYFEHLLAFSKPIHRFGKLRLYTEDTFYQIHYGFTPLSLENVAAFSRLKTDKSKTIIYRSAQEDALALAARLGIETIPPEKIFTLVKEHDVFPLQYLGEEQPQNKRQRRLRICFSKRNGKRFFASGLALFVLSVLTPFAYYYLIYGGLLLLLSAIIRVFGYEAADV